MLVYFLIQPVGKLINETYLTVPHPFQNLIYEKKNERNRKNVSDDCNYIAFKRVHFQQGSGNKKVDKHKEPIEKYGFWGLVLFVGIPLPGTGAWTGCLIASVLNMDKKKAFIASIIGVFMASIIMMIVSFGVIGNLIK